MEFEKVTQWSLRRLHKGVLEGYTREFEGYTREFEKVTQGSLRRLHNGV